MTFLELGAKLREAREARGVTVDEAAAVLKISAKVLHSLEEGDETHLPQTVFIRNFIRAYGRYLGIPEEEIRADALAALAEASSVSGPPPFEVVDEPAHAALPYRHFIVLGLIVALLCAGGYALYANRTLLQESISRVLQESPLQSSKESAAQQKTQAEEMAPQNGAAPAAPSEAAGSAAAQAEAPAEALPPKADAPADKTTNAGGTQDVIVGQQPVAAQPAAAEKDAPAATVQEGNKLVISGLSRCWIRYRADDEKPIDYTLQKGGTLALAFKDRLEVQFGNVRGVRLTYNGEDVPSPAGKSNYKMVFPPSAQ